MELSTPCEDCSEKNNCGERALIQDLVKSGDAQLHDEPQRAIESYGLAIEKLESSNKQCALQAYAYHQQGDAYFLLRPSDKCNALLSYQKSEKLYRELIRTKEVGEEYWVYIAASLFEQGNVYLSKHDFKQAIKLYEDALLISEEEYNDDVRSANTLYQISLAHFLWAIADGGRNPREFTLTMSSLRKCLTFSINKGYGEIAVRASSLLMSLNLTLQGLEEKAFEILRSIGRIPTMVRALHEYRKILDKEDLTEEQIQGFLGNNWILLDLAARRVLPKYRLGGGKFIVDFLVETYDFKYVFVDVVAK